MAFAQGPSARLFWLATRASLFQCLVCYVFRSTPLRSASAKIIHQTTRKLANSMHQDLTPKQGQYLAFIYYYTKITGQAPAEAKSKAKAIGQLLF